jgi:hypothetical protein
LVTLPPRSPTFWGRNINVKFACSANINVKFACYTTTFLPNMKIWNLLKFKGDIQSDLRMCTNEPTFYDTNSLTMFFCSWKAWLLFLDHLLYSRSLKI